MVKGPKSSHQKSGTRWECSDGELQVSQVKNGQKLCVCFGRRVAGVKGKEGHLAMFP